MNSLNPSHLYSSSPSVQVLILHLPTWSLRILCWFLVSDTLVRWTYKQYKLFHDFLLMPSNSSRLSGIWFKLIEVLDRAGNSLCSEFLCRTLRRTKTKVGTTAYICRLSEARVAPMEFQRGFIICTNQGPPIWNTVTGRRDKFTLMDLKGFVLSTFAERRKEPRRLLLHRIFAVLARHEWPRWSFKWDLYTA